MPALMEANRVNGFSGLVLTKLDVLAGLEEIKICIGYKLDGRPITMLPVRAEDVARCIPVYETHPGFEVISEDDWLALAQKAHEEFANEDEPAAPPSRRRRGSVEMLRGTGAPAVNPSDGSHPMT